jgi:hypothetical protein
MSPSTTAHSGSAKEKADPAKVTVSSTHDAAQPAAAVTPVQGLGNGRLQSLLSRSKKARSGGANLEIEDGGDARAVVRHDAEPEDAAVQRQQLGARFGMSFSDVRLRIDAQAAERAERAGARAYTEGREIGFARGVYRPDTPAGRLTIAHEFAHIAQRRGGNMGPAALSSPNSEAAEWQAQSAAAALSANAKPWVSRYSGQGALFDNGKGSGGPTLATSDDEVVFESVLKILKDSTDPSQRSGAIAFLVGLAIKQGPTQKRATDKLFEVLSGIPVQNLSDHMVAIEELKSWTAKEVRAYDLLLYARYWFADHSKNEIGSGLALGAFRNYLHYAGGKWAILFFKQRINGEDKFKANLAARVVADLLEGENDPDEKKYAANYAALRAMARENGWDSYGPLATASATPRIFSGLDAMRQQARVLRRIVITGPVNDPLWEADAELLQKFADAMDTKGSLSRTDPQGGGSTLIYTAENREETEHALIAKPPGTAESVQELARAITIGVNAGANLQSRIEVLHANAGVLDQFLGKDAAATSDERVALFDLRHEYIQTWLSLGGTTFGAKSAGQAEDYQAQLDLVDRHFENFDRMIAQRKFKSARKRFDEYSRIWRDGNERYPGNEKLDESFFFDMQAALGRSHKTLSKGFETSISASVGGMPVVVEGGENIPTDLRRVAALDRDTTIFGLLSAVFLVYATNLSLHNLLIKSDVGSKSFRTEQAAPLIAMRAELTSYWNKGDVGSFLKNTSGYEKTLQNVINQIKHEAKIDFLKNLAITLIAALVTEGAALAVRVASLSEILALARTARAIGSVSTLVNVGVFTAAELSLQKAFFGKDITAPGVAKAVGTNLLFLGALKAVGKIAEPLAQGSVVRQLVIGHLVGFAGVATVSATLTRIETGKWPPDVATFLAQTALTYLLIAGMHAAFQKLVAKPMLFEAASKRWEQLELDARNLGDKLRTNVSAGTLTQADFEAMQAEGKRVIEEGRALYKVMFDGGLISKADMDGINKTCDNALDGIAGAKFPSGTGTDPALKALPAPDSVEGIVRVGNTDTYQYNPATPRAPMTAMLERYREKGYAIEGNNALVRVLGPGGRTQFLLTAGPMQSPRLLLPAGSGSPATTSDPLARATGLAEPQLSTVRNALSAINREVETKLPLDYPDHTVLATLAMLVEQVATIKPGWPIDAVRGVADAMSLERGIPRSAVRRMFLSVDPAKLADVFKNFHEIATSPKVSPGSRYLIADDLIPRNSVTLIDAWRQMQAKGIELPADMDGRATRGVARQIDKMPGGWLQWLSGIAKDQRAAKLRAVSGLTDPTVRLPENVTELLTSISADITGQPGLNPLAGADGEAFVKLIEARSAAAKFDSPDLRAAYVDKVDALRMDVAQLQQGQGLVHGTWENIVGRANEVRKIASVLLTGSTILVSDREVGSKGQLPNVDLAAYTLPGGGKVINVPPGKDVHMDLLYKDPAGLLTALEMTTGELTLPTECAALDPKNPAYGGDVDWAALEAKKDSATHRKFMQAIKIYQLNKMATALGTAWSGQPADPATTRFQAGDFSAGAARALEGMGFKLELLDGTVETAAQVEVRKKGGKTP